jgi:hypothetical protein
VGEIRRTGACELDRGFLGAEEVVDLDDQRLDLGRIAAGEPALLPAPDALDAGAYGLERPEAELDLEPGGGNQHDAKDAEGDGKVAAEPGDRGHKVGAVLGDDRDEDRLGIAVPEPDLPDHCRERLVRRPVEDHEPGLPVFEAGRGLDLEIPQRTGTRERAGPDILDLPVEPAKRDLVAWVLQRLDEGLREPGRADRGDEAGEGCFEVVPVTLAGAGREEIADGDPGKDQRKADPDRGTDEEAKPERPRPQLSASPT